jgi:hypothetical protein
MALLPTNTDYTDKDFDSFKLRLQNLVRSVFPEWTDYNVANFGNILLELFAFSLDTLAFYQDNQALQSRITTATQRRALLGLVKLIGYVPRTNTAATVDVKLSIPASPTNDVVLPAGTIVFTEEITEPIRYQLLTEATITAGASPPEVDVTTENSETREETFASNGLGNQEFSLGVTPYIDDSAVVVAGNGAYSQVDDFLSSTSTDLHFTISVDQNDRAIVRTGNGVNGAVPVGNLVIGYKTGGGSAGRVEAGKLTRIDGSFFDGTNAVAVTVTNAQPSSGGLDRESVSEIKVNAPASITTINRTVSKTDFENNAKTVDSVARSLMLTSNEDVGVAENSGILFIIPEGGGLPSTQLKDDVLTAVTITFPSTLTFQVAVQDPVYLVVNVSVRAYFLAGYVKADVATAIRAALTAFFQVSNDDGTPNTNVDFGGNIKDSAGTIVSELAWSDVLNVVRDVTGVRKIGTDTNDFTLNSVSDDVALTAREFPQLGTVTIIDGDTGGTL